MMLIILIVVLPKKIENDIKESVKQNSQVLVDQIRMFRSYYTENVLSKIKHQSDLKVNFDHKAKIDTVPLPATMIHDLGELFTQESQLEIKMYSNYPFPNRSTRVLDTFEKNSLAYLLQYPNEIYVAKDIYNDQNVIRVAIPDFLYSQSCVDCHNTRIDSPKTDWELGDIRGVIEVITPVDEQISSSNQIVWYVVVFILINVTILIVMIIYLRQKELLELNTTLEESVHKRTSELEFLNRHLSDYKRGIDAGAIISITDSNGIIKEVNDKFLLISGFSRKELIGRPHSCVRHSDMPSSVFQELWSTIQAGNIWQGDIKNRKKDGSSYYVRTTIIPIFNNNNEIYEYLAIRYDITELVEARDQAITAEKSKDDFLSSMSHELRTPLNAIIGFSQILAKKPNIPSDSLSMIEKINISGKNLLRLVNTILDFSKLKSGKLDFLPRYITPKELFREITTITEPMAEQKSITIKQSIKSETPLWGDYDMLKQSLLNFISNAIKFSPLNTLINIEYEIDTVKKNYILSVSDQGEGIDTEGMKKLFTPFTQLQKEHSQSGTGLGLSIVKKMVEDYHKGEIRVTSEVGYGSCFTIIIPMHDDNSYRKA